jgi:hypothetical protein
MLSFYLLDKIFKGSLPSCLGSSSPRKFPGPEEEGNTNLPYKYKHKSFSDFNYHSVFFGFSN